VVDLYARDFGGTGKPIVFIHGLFGSSQNWAGVARRLSARGHCLAVDMRNHGDSPHVPSHGLLDVVEDLRGWTEKLGEGPLRLVGHSMGGTAAMGFALSHPDLVDRLAVVDMAPRPYGLDHDAEFTALSSDISACRTRGEVEDRIRGLVPDARVRAFLLTNAARAGEGFRWRLNTAALRVSTLLSDFSLLGGSCGCPALFLAAGLSRHVRERDHALIRSFFPRAEITIIPGADHWVHVSAPVDFLEHIERFL
jgi:esterase